MEHLVNSLEETQNLVNSFIAGLKGGEVISLIGDLGAGKTTFVQFLASALGVKEKVNSPTFVLMKVYNTSNDKIKNLVHVDAYRLNHSDELKNIGLTEYFNKPDSIVVIEWADKVKDLLSENTLIINFKEGAEDNQRVIEFS